ncbi:hypothetical protein D3C83_107580 [compost metagenome]
MQATKGRICSAPGNLRRTARAAARPAGFQASAGRIQFDGRLKICRSLMRHCVIQRGFILLCSSTAPTRVVAPTSVTAAQT